MLRSRVLSAGTMYRRLLGGLQSCSVWSGVGDLRPARPTGRLVEVFLGGSLRSRRSIGSGGGRA